MLPTSWRRLLSLIRILLAMSCLATQLISSSLVWTDTAILFAVYIIYALVALFWRGLEDSGYPTIALIVDFVFFFISAMSGATYGYWISSVFYAYVLLVAVMLHPWWKTVVVAVAAITLLYVVPTLHSAEMLRPAFIAAGILGSVLAIQREYLEERLSNSSRQTVLYRYDAEKARESERQRIAADFHDGPLQSFISFQMRLEVIRKLMQRDIEAGTRELHQLQELCQSQVADLRGFVRSMRPADEGMGLAASLSRMAELFQRDSGIATTFSGGDLHDPADTQVSLEVLQIVREALNNILKHSGATRVAISAARVDHHLRISVEDNGEGFPFTGSFSLEELELLRL